MRWERMYSKKEVQISVLELNQHLMTMELKVNKFIYVL